MFQKKYDLSNHAKAPVKGRNKFTISIITSFHGRFSVLSALMTLFKLKITTILTDIIVNQ